MKQSNNVENTYTIHPTLRWVHCALSEGKWWNYPSTWVALLLWPCRLSRDCRRSWELWEWCKFIRRRWRHVYLGLEASPQHLGTPGTWAWRRRPGPRLGVSDRFWLFIQTLNNDWKPFNSIFNSNWKKLFKMWQIYPKNAQILLIHISGLSF